MSGSSGNYFLKEFGIDENLCRKLLAKALSRGGDYADLYFEFAVSNYLDLKTARSISPMAIYRWVSGSGR